MNRKLKISLITLTIIALLVAIPLIVLSFGKVQVGYIALSYDNIVANYSSSDVYGPGTHFIGVARQFIRIKQIPTILKIDSQTYTSDYFKLNSKIIVTYQIQNSQIFSAVDNFYINFGSNAQSIIKSIVDKKIVSILSQYSSNFYKQSFNTSNLQTTINNALINIFTYELVVPLLTTVLIQSLVVDGAVSNVQSIDKQIQYTLLQLQRAQNEKIQISNLIQKVKDKSLQQMNIVLEIIKQRVQVIAGLYDKAGTYPNVKIPSILFGNSIVKGNLSYYSSQLKLRPQLYATNQLEIF